MSDKQLRPNWDYNVGLVLAVLGGIILLVKFKVLQLVLSLWPVALIALGWQMYRRGGGEFPRRRSAPPLAAEREDGDEDLE